MTLDKTTLEVQRRLAALGESIPPSGLVDESTVRGVRRFQQKIGLPATGRISPSLLRALRLKSQHLSLDSQSREPRTWLYHSGDLGDIIFSMAPVHASGGAHYRLGPDLRSLPGANKPRSPISPAAYQFIAPLVQSQSYVWSLEWSDTLQPGWFNYNSFRDNFGDPIQHSQLNIVGEHCRVMDVDRRCVERQWLFVKPRRVAKVVMARTPRMQSPLFPWSKLLVKYGNDAVFVGLEEEHEDFCKLFGHVRHQKVTDALELASIIGGADLYIGNWSLHHAIAEALKKPMLVEWQGWNHSIFPREGAVYCRRGDLEIPGIYDDAFSTTRFYHVVSRYVSRHEDSRRRISIAEVSWKQTYAKGMIPAHQWEYDRLFRDGPRQLPYLVDVLRCAIKSINDRDVVVLTNDDTIIHPDLYDVLAAFMANKEVANSFRLDYFTKLTLDNPFGFVGVKTNQSMGRDMFAFRKRWLERHLCNFPDYLFGQTDWDYFLAVYMRITQGLKVDMDNIGKIHPKVEIPYGYIFHEYHQPTWKGDECSTSRDYNHTRTAEFFKRYSLSHMRVK